MSADTIPGADVQKPPGLREFSPRAIIAGMLVAAVMGASYPYIVLKLGFGPNVSVVAAFFGYLALGIIFKNFNRWENNVVQTAGTSAAQTAFMCVILAAFDLLKQSPTLNYTFAPTPFESFLWLTAASILGLLLAVPLRRHYVVDEKLTYADGVAAAETIIVLDSRGRQARDPALALAVGTLLSGFVFFVQQKQGGHLIPEMIFPVATFFGIAATSTGAGIAVSLLGVGSGMIVGNRINVSMLIGAVLSWVIAPKLLSDHGIVTEITRGNILRWVMWPGTALIICAGLTSLALSWRTLVRSFSNLSSRSVSSDEFPLRWVMIGIGLASAALVAIQIFVFGLPWWMTLIAVVVSIPLMLVGLRVLGETNWGPISQLTNLMQALFAGLAPGNVTVNMATSGTTGTIAVQSEAIMQDYKAGHIIGSTPRFLTYAQLIAAPIGAAAVAWTYPMLRDISGIGGDGLSSPISQRIAGFSEFLTQGGAALLAYAGHFALIFGVLGILIAVLEKRYHKYLPSPTGLGIGMMVPGAVIVAMFLGGLLLKLWEQVHKPSADRLSVPLASGLIAGEAIVAVLIPLLILVGLLSA